MVEIRNGCLSELYMSEAFVFGFRGRANGCRTIGHESPMAGSNITIGDEDEVVVIYQSERGMGPVVVNSYLREPGLPGTLGNNIRAILRKNGFIE